MTLPRTAKMVLSGAAATMVLLTAACGGESGDSGSGSSSQSTSDAGGAPAEDLPTTFAPGDYAAEGSYQTPGGQQSVEVEVTLEEDGTITAVSVTPQADGGNSEQFQTKFAGGIADEIVGTKINDLNVSKVSGSSLTSGGFNAAIDEIRDDAAA